jgi:hypothetical protein
MERHLPTQLQLAPVILVLVLVLVLVLIRLFLCLKCCQALQCRVLILILKQKDMMPRVVTNHELCHMPLNGLKARHSNDARGCYWIVRLLD